MNKKKIGIIYIGEVILSEELVLIEETLTKMNIEVKMHDRKGDILANLEDLTSVISIIFNYPLLLSFIESIGSNAAWDAIKLISIQLWSKIKGKKYTKLYAGGKTEEKDISFGVQAKINNNNYNFKFDGMNSEEDVNRALDKIIDFFKVQTTNNNNKSKIYVAKYKTIEQEWEVVDFEEIIKGKIKESKQ